MVGLGDLHGLSNPIDSMILNYIARESHPWLAAPPIIRRERFQDLQGASFADEFRHRGIPCEQVESRM